MAPKENRPLRVAYDIHRLSAGGANGGIKVHHYEFLRSFVEHHSHELQLHIFCQEEIIPELTFLSSHGNHQVHVIGTRAAYEPRNSNGTLPVLHYWAELPPNLLVLLEIDVLYCGFGYSPLYTPDVPQVSLIVDVLHRAHPESLPPAEVEHRDRWYAEAIEKSALIQTNSQFCKQQLVDEFNADPEKIFTIALPLHGRFNRVEMGPLPEQLRGLEHKYFLYPANYWPHKNHKRLIEAYALYQKEVGDEALHLALTGSPGAGEDYLKKQCRKLGITKRVHFLGHLDLATLKAAYELCAAVVFPTLYEGFGLPVIEAQYFQKPLLSSYTSSLIEIASTGAQQFNPYDRDAVTKSLEQHHKDSRANNTYIEANLDVETNKLISFVNIAATQKIFSQYL